MIHLKPPGMALSLESHSAHPEADGQASNPAKPAATTAWKPSACITNEHVGVSPLRTVSSWSDSCLEHATLMLVAVLSVTVANADRWNGAMACSMHCEGMTRELASTHQTASQLWCCALHHAMQRRYQGTSKACTRVLQKLKVMYLAPLISQSDDLYLGWLKRTTRHGASVPALNST